MANFARVIGTITPPPSRRKQWLLALVCAALAPGAPIPAQRPDTAALRMTLQHKLDSLRASQPIPGLSFAMVLAGGERLAIVSGVSDTARRLPLRTTDRLLQGSVGKTYVSAIAMQLVHEGKLRLDDPLSRFFGSAPWFARLPNAPAITVRHLMNHTSGLVRYEFQPAFTAALRAEPFRNWTPLERLEYIFDSMPPFAAGAGWEYSDTNYIVLGMIIEQITGGSYYDALRSRLLVPLGLTNTIPSDRPDLPGVANGYAGTANALGGYDASLVNGRLAVNPGLEWTGGGVASTTEDLARWAKLLYEAKAFDAAMLPVLLEGVPARLGRDTQYGLGVIIRPTAQGTAYGHSGFFPGYATEMLYFPDARIAVAIQANVSAPFPRGLVPFLVEAVRVAR